jgi:hypothetical protein
MRLLLLSTLPVGTWHSGFIIDSCVVIMDRIKNQGTGRYGAERDLAYSGTYYCFPVVKG